MKRLALMTIAAALPAASAMASQTQTACVRGDFTRSVEVAAPGRDGRACEVIYRKPTEGAPEDVPWFAKFGTDFCAEKADNLVATLRNAGWQCASVGGAPELMAAAAPAPVPAPAAEPAPQEAAPTAPEAPEAPAETAADAEVTKIVADLTALLEEEEPTPAPAAAPPVEPQAPKTPKTVVEPTPVAVATPAAETQTAVAAPALRLPAEETSSGDTWTDEDAVRAVLRAKQAAWNEGDVDGVMLGYWNSRELRHVAGGTVVKGWKATRKHFRGARDAGQLHDLEFYDVDVRILAQGNAVAFGKWRMEEGEEMLKRGVFTLLLEKIDGAWRVVHDHTSDS